MKIQKYLMLSTLVFGLPLPAATLVWDPGGNQDDSGGGGTWDASSLNWDDNGTAPNVAWTNGDEAIFPGAGDVVAIASGASIVVDSLIFENISGNYNINADTGGEGFTIQNGGFIDGTGATGEVRIADDTVLMLSNGDSIDVDMGGTPLRFTNNQRDSNPFQVAGANLNLLSGTIWGGENDIGRFGSVTMSGGTTFRHQRNNGGIVVYNNDWILDGTATFIRRTTNSNGTYELAGAISGAGGMIIDPGAGGGGRIDISNAGNSFTGDVTISSGSQDSGDDGGNTYGLQVLGEGQLGDGNNNIILNAGLRLAPEELITLNGDISGSGGALMVRSAEVTAGGTNTYSGDTYLRGGTLTVTGVNSLSPNSNIVFAGQDPFLNLGAGDFTRSLGTGANQVQWTSGGGFGAVGADRTVNIGGAAAALTFGVSNFVPDSETAGIQVGSAESTHTTTLVNPLVLPTDDTGYNLRSENGSADIDGIFAGAISGPGDVDTLGGGVLKFTNASNSFTGNVEVQQGALLADPLTAIPDLSLVTVTEGASFGGDTGSLTNGDFDNILATATFESGSALAFDTTTGNYNYGSDLSGDVGVAKVGPNTLTLSGTLSYTGPTVIYRGSIDFGGGGLPAGSALTLNDNVFDLGGISLQTGGLGSFTEQAAIINTGANADLVMDVPADNNPAFLGTLGQSGGTDNDFNVIKRGEGRQSFQDVNFYTGTTTIEGGRIDAPQPETFGLDPGLTDLNRVTVTGGDVRIDVFGVNPWTDFTGLSARFSGGKDSVLGLNMDLSTQSTAGEWNPAALTGDHGYRINPLESTDVTIFDEANTYTGSTIIQTGVMELQVADALGTGDGILHIINNDTQSVVDLNGNDQTIGGLLDTGGGGSQTKSLDNSTGIAVVTIDVDAGEYYQYSRNIRNNSGLIDFVKDGDGEQVFQRGGTVSSNETEITVNAGTFGLDQAFDGATGVVTVDGGLFELEGSTGLFVEINSGGAFGPGINGDDDNDGISDEDDPDTTTESTVGTATVTDVISFASGSTFEFEIGDWNGADDLGGTAGTDWDLLAAADSDFTGTLTVVIGGAVADFTEVNKTLVILQGTNAPTGFVPGNVTINDSAFPGAGTWAIAQNANNIELQYTAAAGDAYDAWAATNITSGPTGFDEDANGDTVENGLNFVLGGDPMVANLDILPSASNSSGDLVFSFQRTDESEGITTQTFQWSVDLGTWNDVTVGAGNSGPDGDGVTVGVTENGAALDDIQVTVPSSNAPNGRIFGRLMTTRP